MIRESLGQSTRSSRAAPPAVSVVIPAYNAGRTLGPCVRSVLAADYNGPLEVLVVDDGSTDDTIGIAERVGCKVVRMACNSGPALARNAGAAEARGDVLIFVDADTEMRCDAIANAVRALQENGVVAVGGMYEAEPINAGFFPRYYAYLKYHAFTAEDVGSIYAFSGQCGAIRKATFERVGGYRPVAWGVDIENEELGHRLMTHGRIALARDFVVRHNFPGLRKLLFVFNNRVYWWILFKHFSKRDETVLMTRGFGCATAALPAASVCAACSPFAPHPAAWLGLQAIALVLLAAYVRGYIGFWQFCTGRRGVMFGLACALASAMFSFVITFGAARGYLRIAWSALRRRQAPFAPPRPAGGDDHRAAEPTWSETPQTAALGLP